MTSSERPPRPTDRPEGDPPDEQTATSDRTPHAQEPAEGPDPVEGGEGDQAT